MWVPGRARRLCVKGDHVEQTSPLFESISNLHARRDRLKQLPAPELRRPTVVAVTNQKGGVGKTTTAVNVAAALGNAGMNVVLIDLDPQGNASTAFSIPHQTGVPSSYEVILGDIPLVDALQEAEAVPNVRVCPATIDLAGAEVELVGEADRADLLDQAIDQFLEEDGAEIIIIDCPPSLGLLTLNSLVAAEEILIPVQAEYYALEGLSLLLSTINKVRASLNPDLGVPHMVMTMVDGRTNLAAEVSAEVREHFAEQVFQTEIARSVRISEAPSYGETVITYDPKGGAAVAYTQLAYELTDRLRRAQDNE